MVLMHSPRSLQLTKPSLSLSNSMKASLSSKHNAHRCTAWWGLLIQGKKSKHDIEELFVVCIVPSISSGLRSLSLNVQKKTEIVSFMFYLPFSLKHILLSLHFHHLKFYSSIHNTEALGWGKWHGFSQCIMVLHQCVLQIVMKCNKGYQIIPDLGILQARFVEGNEPAMLIPKPLNLWRSYSTAMSQREFLLAPVALGCSSLMSVKCHKTVLL